MAENQLGDIDQAIAPNAGENPSNFADRLGVYYTSTVNDSHKKDLGQFFTPLKIAEFMADFNHSVGNKVKILDPGCGVGILTAALVESIVGKNAKIKTIELVAFETDIHILPLAESCFRYLTTWLQEKNIDFTYFLCKNDFILHNSHVLANQECVHESYDIVISNPPYFKLPKDDERAIAAKAVIYGQTNIYTIFLLIAARLINDTGQLVFITPRSFCSGNYFRLFREIFFSSVNIKTIHVFNSRKEAFKRDNVLQENIVIIATKNRRVETTQLQLPLPGTTNHSVTISCSHGIDDLDHRRTKNYEWQELINLTSFQKILHLPLSEIDEQVIEVFKSWTGSLSAYDLEISTGRVVDFRSTHMICKKKTKNTVPLIWLHNIEPMNFLWPKNDGYKGKSKAQYIKNNQDSFSRLVPNKNYVLLRRFSSKDDNRRLIAAPYIKSYINEAPMLGIENHLNYIYHINEELSEKEAVGLAGLLNSRLFDLYFRTFNGNINVSATELRETPLPDFELIKLLGQQISDLKTINRDFDIDSMISKVFGLSIDLSNF